DRRHRRTIPEPFSVAENVDEKAARRRKALAEERVRRELEECTFEPATNASRRS
ncbi:unnamed product, partial [Ostreococcus tauri]